MTWQEQYQQDGGAADLFQRYIVPRITSLWGRNLVDRAGVHVGENVLDVACGTGVVTRLAAAQSCTGRVVGLDLMRICSELQEALPMRRARRLSGVREALWLFPLAKALLTSFYVSSASSSFRTNPSPSTRWRAFSLSEAGFSLAYSPPSNGLRLRTLMRAPLTDIAAKAPLLQSAPSILFGF